MDYKTKIIDGVEVAYSADWIEGLEREDHFNWYYHQASLVYKYCDRSDHILEIGVGSSLLSDLLRRRKWEIATLDIDADKHPDICTSAVEFDYASITIDVVLAFEVFEHIPFVTFEQVVNRLGESKVKRIFFSLPWNEYRLVDFSLSMPIIHDVKFRIPLSKNKITTHAHFWELAKRERNLDEKKLVTVESISRLFDKGGYNLTPLNKVRNIQFFEANFSDAISDV